MCIIARSASAFTEGSPNNYFGTNAGGAEGTGNSFFGAFAGDVNTGNDNSFYGYGAGFLNDTGSQNTFNGFRAGRYNTTGSNNTFSGNIAGESNTTGFSNTFNGSFAGNLNTSGNSNVFMGYKAGNGNTTGYNNTYYGYKAGSSNSTGNGNLFLGYKAGENETGSNRLYIANSSYPLIYGEFDYGIVEVYGDFYVTGNSYITSDARFKKDIELIDSSLRKIMNIRGVSYTWRTDQAGVRGFDEKRHFGVVGQEVAAVLPEAVSKDREGIFKVAYSELIPVMIEAIKEQQQIITELSKKVDDLERKVKLKVSMSMVDTR